MSSKRTTRVVEIPDAKSMRLAAARLRLLGNETRAQRGQLDEYRARLWSVAKFLEMHADQQEKQ